MKFDFSPSEEFARKAKERFLATFDARYPAARSAGAPRFIFVLKAAAGIAAVFAVLLGGASVYADTRNVSADNPLYPLKRLTESVQLALTTPAAKPQLEATFAARRAGEITDLEDRHPTSTLLPKLASDLAGAVNASIGDAERQNVAASSSVVMSVSTSTSTSTATSAPKFRERQFEGSQTPQPLPQQSSLSPQSDLAGVCNTLRTFLGASSSVTRNGFLNGSSALRRFKDQCDGQENGQNDSHDNGSASSTATSTANFSIPSIFTHASSTISTTSTFPRGSGSRDDFRGRFDDNSSD